MSLLLLRCLIFIYRINQRRTYMKMNMSFVCSEFILRKKYRKVSSVKSCRLVLFVAMVFSMSSDFCFLVDSLNLLWILDIEFQFENIHLIDDPFSFQLFDPNFYNDDPDMQVDFRYYR